MKILIAGGAGFIGSSLCLKLKEKYPHYHITAFDNLKRRGSELNLIPLQKMGISFVHGDIRNAEDLQSINHFDILIEASAEPSVLTGLTNDPAYIINNNLYGSINCLNACLRNNAKIIFLSTSRVYPIDKIENAIFIEENTRFAFADHQIEKGISNRGISEELTLSGARSFYGATKLCTEIFINEYAAFYNIESAITRLGVIAGPHQMGKSDQGVATLWMAKHFWRQSLKYIGYGGSGKQVRDILHIDDLVELIDFQIHTIKKFSGTIYNAGGGKNTSVSLVELTQICQEITGNKVKIEQEVQNRPADLKAFITDNTKITSETGWKPMRSVEKTMVDTFEWISKNERQLRPLLK